MFIGALMNTTMLNLVILKVRYTELHGYTSKILAIEELERVINMLGILKN